MASGVNRCQDRATFDLAFAIASGDEWQERLLHPLEFGDSSLNIRDLCLRLLANLRASGLRVELQGEQFLDLAKRKAKPLSLFDELQL